MKTEDIIRLIDETFEEEVYLFDPTINYEDGPIELRGMDDFWTSLRKKLDALQGIPKPVIEEKFEPPYYGGLREASVEYPIQQQKVNIMSKLLTSYGWDKKGKDKEGDTYYSHKSGDYCLTIIGGKKNIFVGLMEVYKDKHGWQNLFEDDKIFEGKISSKKDFKYLMKFLDIHKIN